MNTITARNCSSDLAAFRAVSRKELFREKFQRSLRCCVRKGFSVEEAFGMIWLETWEELRLRESEEAELYEELIEWTKRCPL